MKGSGFVFASGSLGNDPVKGEFAPDGVEAETRHTLQNLAAVLEAGASPLDRVAITTGFLCDINDFGKMNVVYAEFLPKDPPARSTFKVVVLPKGAAVEIEAIALREAH